jgi:hypothetical protein
MKDTRLVLALVALVLVCLTVLVALDKVSSEQAGIWAGGLLNGLALAWKRKDADKKTKPKHPDSERLVP